MFVFFMLTSIVSTPCCEGAKTVVDYKSERFKGELVHTSERFKGELVPTSERFKAELVQSSMEDGSHWLLYSDADYHYHTSGMIYEGNATNLCK